MFLVVAVVIAVAGGAVLARAYTLRDSVLPGVSVAGVDVGGLAPADARARIDAELGARLDEPGRDRRRRQVPAGDSFQYFPG